MRDRPLLERRTHRFAHADVFHQHRHGFDRRMGGNENQRIVRAQFVSQLRRGVGCEQIAGLPAERENFDSVRSQAARGRPANETTPSENDGAIRFARGFVKIGDHKRTCSINPPSSRIFS
jgi:hypothetical protein